jgi:Fur family zinc uptake transcriptional regulator
MTVYRALKFLSGYGFVHRIESRNAYLGCLRPHAAGDLVLFMICDRCGAVAETSSTQAASIIETAAREAGFTPKSWVIEISGMCTHCREKRTQGRARDR